METKVTTPPIKGLIIALILIVYGLVLYFTNQLGNQTLGYIQYVIILVGVIWSCIIYSQQLNANVTFGNLFAHGFKTTAVITVIIILYTVLAFNVLFPDIVDKSMEISRQKMEETGKYSDNQISEQIAMVKDHFTLFAVAAILIFFAIIGALGSLIGAAVAKKKPQDPFGNQVI